MSGSTDVTPLERSLHGFIADELVSDDLAQSIGPGDDLIKLGVVDSLGVMQLVDFCESQYGIRVTDAELVPENFRTLRALAEYVERKQAAGSP
jgi:acyl carrier protein